MPVLVSNQPSNPTREEPTEDQEESSPYNGDNYSSHSNAQNEPVVRTVRFFFRSKIHHFRLLAAGFIQNYR